MIEFDENIISGAGKDAAVAGFANELVVLSMLMTKYPNSSKVDMPLASYDIIIERAVGSKVSFLRAQVKTASKSISFTGGSRGGVDRNYDRSVNQSKIYVHNSTTSDLIIGIHRSAESTVLYLIPTLVREYLNQSSLSVNKAKIFSDWEMITLCDDETNLKSHLKGKLAKDDPLLKIEAFKNWVNN